MQSEKKVRVTRVMGLSESKSDLCDGLSQSKIDSCDGVE